MDPCTRRAKLPLLTFWTTHHAGHPASKQSLALCMRRSLLPHTRRFFASTTTQFLPRPLVARLFTSVVTQVSTSVSLPRSPYKHHRTFRFSSAPTIMEEITATLKGVGLESVPKEPGTYPENNPFDIYRSHITEILASQTGIDAKIIRQTLAWTSKAEHGDLQVNLQAWRQPKGTDLKALANDIAEKVRDSRSPSMRRSLGGGN